MSSFRFDSLNRNSDATDITVCSKRVVRFRHDTENIVGTFLRNTMHIFICINVFRPIELRSKNIIGKYYFASAHCADKIEGGRWIYHFKLITSSLFCWTRYVKIYSFDDEICGIFLT